jgi:hypothetical protein
VTKIPPHTQSQDKYKAYIGERLLKYFENLQVLFKVV